MKSEGFGRALRSSTLFGFKNYEMRQMRHYKDVFPKRWENKNSGKSGYMPICNNEWRQGICLKLQKGKCRDCSYQKYPPFSFEYAYKIVDECHHIPAKTFSTVINKFNPIEII